MLLVLVAEFEESPERELHPVPEPRSVRTADVYFGEPGVSSPRYEAEVALEKPFVDVLVNATAYVPGGGTARNVEVALELADIRKQLLILGDRSSLVSTPRPFSKMPIIYERAFGGTDPDGKYADQRNLIGVGFRGAPPTSLDVATSLPNIEYPQSPNQPAGFGGIARGWQPRISFAGTFDESWLSERWPLLPHDYDSRHNQTAPTDQQSRILKGGEEVRLTNLTPDGFWAFRLPRLNIPVWMFYPTREVQAELRLDTILIEPDERRVTLTARAAFPVIRCQGPPSLAVLGHMTRGWLRAMSTRKDFLDWSGTNGVDSTRSCYE